MPVKSSLKLAVAAVGIVILFSLLLGTYFTVDQHMQTVVTRFGRFLYVADPGLHFKLPYIDSVTRFRTDLQDMAPDNPVNTYTIDNQEIDVRFTVFFRTPSDKIAFIYANNRDYRDRLFSLTIDRLKAAMGKVNVQNVAEKRADLRDTIKATLAHDALPLGIEVTDFQLTDLQYTDSFRQAVSNAAVQKANIESVEYRRQQAEKEALTAKVKAEGEANAVRAAAAGEADARVLKAQAEAKAIQLQGEAQAAAIMAQVNALKTSPDYVALRRAERWDGKLPAAIYAGTPIPFLQAEK